MNQNTINTKNSLFPQEDFETEDDDSWQVSYLDIITIILGFLVILLSVSEVTKQNYSSLSELFGALSDRTQYITTPVEEIQEELQELLQPQIERGELEVVRDLNDIRIRFRGDDFYSSGSANLHGSGMNLLNHVLRAFQQSSYNDFQIDVEGHTDNVPITTANYPSNWELSTARASNVVKYFSMMGIDPARLKASGYADSRPRIQYNSEGLPMAAPKELNRRIVLRLYYDADQLSERRAREEALARAGSPSDENESVADEVTQPDNTQSTEPPETESVPQTVTPEEPVRQENVQKEAPKTVLERVAEARSQPQEKSAEPEPDPEPELPPAKKERDAAIKAPSFADESMSCSFAVQVGSSSRLSNSFQLANQSERNTGYEYELSYNRRIFSVRTEAESDFSEALVAFRNITRQMVAADAGLVHQCYPPGRKKPMPVSYGIQFGAFRGNENALNFTVSLLDTYGIQTYMNRESDTYLVTAGPYSDRNTASEKLNEFREKGVKENIFIKPLTDGLIDYQYNYQLYLAGKPSMVEAQILSQELLDQLGVITKIVSLTNDTYYVVSEQFSDQQAMLSLLNRLNNSGLSLSPIPFFLEYY